MKRTETTRHRLLRRTALLLIAVSGIFAGTLRAQEQTVTLPSMRLTAGDAISLIESQAGLIIGVNHGNFDVGRQITVKSTRIGVDELLEQIVAGTDHTYIRKDRHVIIVSDGKPRTAAKAEPVKNTPPPSLKDESVAALELEIPDEEAPEPETRTYKTVSYNNPSQRLSFSADDPDSFTDIGGKQPFFALKTNLTHAIFTLTPNLGVEFGLGRRTTLEVSGGWNPWKLHGKIIDSGNGEGESVSSGGNKKLVHIYVQPEFRWWLCERFNGHFFGVHAVGAVYNISQYTLPLTNFKKDYRYQGYAAGAGVSYGYELMLSSVVNLEFTLGVGVWWLKYDRYACATCSRSYESFDEFHFGPTKAGISLSFIIK